MPSFSLVSEVTFLKSSGSLVFQFERSKAGFFLEHLTVNLREALYSLMSHELRENPISEVVPGSFSELGKVLLGEKQCSEEMLHQMFIRMSDFDYRQHARYTLRCKTIFL